MIRIWATTTHGDKITRSYIYTIGGNYDERKMSSYVMDICDSMNIPTPVMLRSHKQKFSRFNIVRFRPDDFVESVDFDMLVLENASVEPHDNPNYI